MVCVGQGRKGGLQGCGFCLHEQGKKAFCSISHPIMKCLASRGMEDVMISSELQGGLLQRQLIGSAPAGKILLYSLESKGTAATQGDVMHHCCLNT